VAEPGEFAVDAPIAPRRVLGGESDNELFSVADGAGPAWPPLRVHPSGRGQSVVPRQQRVGRDNGSVTDPPGDRAGEPGDHATIDVGELGTVQGSLQDRDLVTEGDDFIASGSRRGLPRTIINSPPYRSRRPTSTESGTTPSTLNQSRREPLLHLNHIVDNPGICLQRVRRFWEIMSP
jgi:hypothetical protein